MTLTSTSLMTREPTLRVIAQPTNMNVSGAIFGGWLMSQIDLAGAQVGILRAKGPIATVAVLNIQFLRPLYVHDVVSFYANVIAVGTTSLTVRIEAFAQRLKIIEPGKCDEETFKVSEATFVYVAVNKPGEKRAVPPA